MRNNFAVTTGEDYHQPPALKGQMPQCPCILGQVRSVSVCGFHRDTVEGGDVFQHRWGAIHCWGKVASTKMFTQAMPGQGRGRERPEIGGEKLWK